MMNPTATSPLALATSLLVRNPDLILTTTLEDGALVVDRAAGYPHPERTEAAIWETLPVELCELLEAERVGGGTIALRERPVSVFVVCPICHQNLQITGIFKEGDVVGVPSHRIFGVESNRVCAGRLSWFSGSPKVVTGGISCKNQKLNASITKGENLKCVFELIRSNFFILASPPYVSGKPLRKSL